MLGARVLLFKKIDIIPNLNYIISDPDNYYITAENGTFITWTVNAKRHSIAGNYYHTMAIGTDGTLSAWGSNLFGQLGNNSIEDSLVPIKINLPPVASVACGYNYTMALGTDGTLSAWGYNKLGQLGNGSDSDSHVPIKINLPPVAIFP